VNIEQIMEELEKLSMLRERAELFARYIMENCESVNGAGVSATTSVAEVRVVFQSAVGPYKFIYDGDDDDYEDDFSMAELKMQIYLGE
jgi:hypothetical protein